MLFACDLDRTLIYSPAAAGEHASELIVIERKDDEVISCVTERILLLLSEVRQKSLFVPVTTRTTEQYLRVDLFTGDDVPDWAVTANGGNILRNGVALPDWRSNVETMIRERSLPLLEMQDKVDKLLPEKAIILSRHAEELFFYYVVERNMLSHELLSDLNNLANGCNWQVSLQGRKLYFLPAILRKDLALQEIATQTSEKTLIAAGDSLLDLDMLLAADKAICPSHGEIYMRKLENLHAVFTANEGIRAGEDILAQVLEWIKAGDVLS